MSDSLSQINLRETPQSEQADPRQVPNSAGGFTFTIDPIAQLRRFLILGTDGGTYYASERDITVENAKLVIELARTRGRDVLREVADVSVNGRAPRQNPALFALAAVQAFGDPAAKVAAAATLPGVARTGTHLFIFARYAEQMRGWGRSLRRAVAFWYETKDPESLAYQVTKYRQREGWSHRDLLRSAHPGAPTPVHKLTYDWICGRLPDAAGGTPEAIAAFTLAQASETPARTAELVRTFRSLSWEMLQSEHLNDREVWEALIEQGLPQTALMRQLPRLTRLGLLAPMSTTAKVVTEQLIDGDRIRRARLHPLSILVALRTYASGHGARGQDSWEPVAPVVEALDAAFYAAFDNVEPTGQRTLLALDVSASMDSPIAGQVLTAREATSALAMVTARVEPAHDIVGFTSSPGRRSWSRMDSAITRLDLSSRRRLDDVMTYTRGIPFGGTDCALPMLWALQNEVEVDVFQILTDSETWAGTPHPHQALNQYRQRTGIPAKLVVLATTPTPFSIADPSDPGMLDVVGFDTSVPAVIADFAKGSVTG